MLNSINLIYHQVIEAYAEGGVRKVFHRRIFWNRLSTPVVMELSSPNFPLGDHPHKTNFKFVEIKMNDLKDRKWSFAIPSRGFKALLNFKRGFRCFAVTEGSTVVGDVWCLTPHKDGKRISHTDLELLGIKCEEGDAYAFDMFIATAYRGKDLASPLHKFLQASVKMEGCQKVYGYYENDNLPALWMHRMLRYKELPKRRISRFFFLVSSKAAGSNEGSH